MCRSIRHILMIVLLQSSTLCFGQLESDDSTTLTHIIEPAEGEDASVKRISTFSIITEPEPVEVKKVPQEKVEAMKKDDAYWYANLEPEKKKKKENIQSNENRSSPLNQTWLQNLLWIIILCSFIGIVIWYLASSNISLFRKESKKIIEEEEEAEITDDIFGINYEKEINRAAETGNFRLAVRLWYLQTLKELADRNIIDYRHEKTDNDYVASLYGGRYYRDFFRLTRNFEYTWYGQFQLSAEAYSMMSRDFLNFKNS